MEEEKEKANGGRRGRNGREGEVEESIADVRRFSLIPAYAIFLHSTNIYRASLFQGCSKTLR